MEKSKIEALPEHILSIMQRLEDYNYEVFLVGGCVRNLLLGQTPVDYDLVCSASLVQISSIFSRILPIGAKHGTVMVLVDDHRVELSTYKNTDLGALNGQLSALERDLAGRDFTINAIAMDASGNLYDPWGGSADLQAKKIKATCNQAEQRFTEDPLRMMRAIRFATVYDFQICEETCAAILKLNHLLGGVARERVREELNRILISKRASHGIRGLQASGLMAYIIPELELMVGLDQRNIRHNRDLFEHSLAVLDGVPARLNVRLAALLHDIGKPACFTVDAAGIGHFYNHHQAGIEISKTILQRLKYDSVTVNNVALLVGAHMTRFARLRNAPLKQLIRQLGENSLQDMYDLQKADILGSAPPFEFAELEQMQLEISNIMHSHQPLELKDLAVSGSDLIALGYTPGPNLGEALQKLLDVVLENPAKNQREVLLEIARHWKH
jgi:tRNA nucleotidyltransferase (CCA-adding enzyme)